LVYFNHKAKFSADLFMFQVWLVFSALLEEGPHDEFPGIVVTEFSIPFLFLSTTPPRNDIWHCRQTHRDFLIYNSVLAEPCVGAVVFEKLLLLTCSTFQTKGSAS